MYSLRDADFTPYSTWHFRPSEFVPFCERDNLGSDITLCHPKSFLGADSYLSPVATTQFHVVRRFPTADTVVAEELWMVIERLPDWAHLNMSPVQVPSEVWKWAFQQEEPFPVPEFKLGIQKDLPVKVVLVSSMRPPYFLIKGPPTLLLLLAQQRFPLDKLSAEAIRYLQDAWEEWLNETAIAMRGNTPGDPRILLPNDRMLEVPQILASKTSGSDILRQFVEEAWVLEEDDRNDGTEEGMSVPYKWTPVHLRDARTRELFAAWAKTDRIQRVTKFFDVKMKNGAYVGRTQTFYRLNNKRAGILPEDHPQLSWEKVALKPIQTIRRAWFLPTLSRPMAVRPIQSPDQMEDIELEKNRSFIDHFCLFFDEVQKRKVIPMCIYGSPLWYDRDDGKGHIFRISGDGHGDIQVFLDLCSPYGHPVEAWEFTTSPDEDEFIVKMPIAIIKAAAGTWVGKHYSSLLHLARVILHLRNESLLCVDMLFPRMTRDPAFASLVDAPEVAEQLEDWYVYPFDGPWTPVFTQSAAFDAYKKVVAKRKRGEIDHPVRIFDALQELEEKDPKAVEELERFFTPEDDEDEEEESEDEEEQLYYDPNNILDSDAFWGGDGYGDNE